MMGQFLQLVVGIFRPREFHQLDFLELMLANDSAHVFPIGSRLAAKARSIRSDGNRQSRRVDDLVAIEIGQRDFGGGNQPQVSVLAFE